MRPRLAAPTLAVVERDHASVQIHVRAPQPQELRRTLATDMDTDLDGIAPGIHRLSLHALEERGELALVKIPGERAVVLRERIDGSDGIHLKHELPHHLRRRWIRFRADAERIRGVEVAAKLGGGASVPGGDDLAD